MNFGPDSAVVAAVFSILEFSESVLKVYKFCDHSVVFARLTGGLAVRGVTQNVSLVYVIDLHRISS